MTIKLICSLVLAFVFSSVLGKSLTELAEKDENITAITAAMESGTGLDSFAERFPKRFFDVGIAEAHGVSFAAGMSAGGLKPVFAVYSTFLQRGFDMLITSCIRISKVIGNDIHSMLFINHTSICCI